MHGFLQLHGLGCTLHSSLVALADADAKLSSLRLAQMLPPWIVANPCAVLALEDIGGAPIVPAAFSMSTIRPKKVTVGTAVVSFDGCSHSSRERRAYIDCTCGAHFLLDQPRCCRYTTVSLYASERRCVAFLLGWARCPSWVSDRQSHRYFYPSDRDVDAIEATIPRLV